MSDIMLSITQDSHELLSYLAKVNEQMLFRVGSLQIVVSEDYCVLAVATIEDSLPQTEDSGDNQHRSFATLTALRLLKMIEQFEFEDMTIRTDDVKTDSKTDDKPAKYIALEGDSVWARFYVDEGFVKEPKNLDDVYSELKDYAQQNVITKFSVDEDELEELSLAITTLRSQDLQIKIEGGTSTLKACFAQAQSKQPEPDRESAHRFARDIDSEGNCEKFELVVPAKSVSKLAKGDYEVTVADHFAHFKHEWLELEFFLLSKPLFAENGTKLEDQLPNWRADAIKKRKDGARIRNSNSEGK